MKNRLKKILSNCYSPNAFISFSAIVVMKDDTTFEGVSIKNSVFRDAIYAEQVAISSAVAHGYKKDDFEEIHIMIGSTQLSDFKHLAYEVIEEFFNKDKTVTCMNVKGDQIMIKVKDIHDYVNILRLEV